MSTSATRNENRLSDEDRAAIISRLTETVADWPTGYRAVPSDHLALERVAAHAIGCALHDLRNSERDEIAAMVRTFVNGNEA